MLAPTEAPAHVRADVPLPEMKVLTEAEIFSSKDGKPDHELLRQHLLGLRGDNNMYGSADVFDLHLAMVGSYSPGPAVVSRAGWADSEHLVVATVDWHDNTWSLVRVGLDGTRAEVLDGPASGRNPETVAEYLLSE